MSDAGEIVGRLRLDAGNWFEELDRAEAKARELGGVSPKVRVSAEGTAKTVAELAAVKAAEDEVGKSAVAAGKKQKDAAQQAGNAQGALIGALVAVSAAAPPVAAAAVGITGAFGVMAGAGVLGVMGIARGLKEGNAVGREYQGTIEALTGSLHSAQDAAANGLFPGVQKSAFLLRQDMPALNGEIDHFAGMLGSMLPTGLDATVTLLERANPLFDEAGRYLGSLVTGLDQWAHSTGYQDFLNYSIQSLPQVEHLLGDTGHLVIDFLKAWAPIGTTTLPLLDDLVTGVDDIVRHTGPLVPGVIAVVGAYKLLEPMIGIVKGLTAATVGLGEAEAGAAAAGAGGLGGAAGAAGGGAAAGRFAVGGAAAGVASKVLPAAALAALITSLPGSKQGNDIGSFFEGFAPESWKVKGLATDIASQNVTGHLAPNSNTSIGQSDKQLAGMVNSGDAAKAAAAFAKIKTAADANGVSISHLVALYPQYSHALAGTTGALTAQTPITTHLTAAQAAQVMSLRQVAEGFRSTMAAAELLGNSYDDVTIAQGSLIASFQAQAKASKTGKVSLDENTVAGAQNAEQMRGAVDKIRAHADAINADGKHAEQARAYTLEHARSLEVQATKAGADKGKVDALVGSLIDVSKTHPVSKIDVQTAQFAAKVAAIRSQMAAINGLTSDVYINAVAVGVNPSRAAQINRNAMLGGAHGGTAGDALFGALPHLATGGTIRGAGTAATDTAGLYRLANGEEVVSNLFGGASALRPLLKSISAGKVRSKADALEALGGQRQGPQQVIHRTIAPEVHIHNPVAVDPVTQSAEAAQLALAYAGLG